MKFSKKLRAISIRRLQRTHEEGFAVQKKKGKKITKLQNFKIQKFQNSPIETRTLFVEKTVCTRIPGSSLAGIIPLASFSWNSAKHQWILRFWSNITAKFAVSRRFERYYWRLRRERDIDAFGAREGFWTFSLIFREMRNAMKLILSKIERTRLYFSFKTNRRSIWSLDLKIRFIKEAKI